MTRMVNTRIHGVHHLMLPEHRANRPEWPWWEAARLSAEHEAIRRTFERHPRGCATVWCVGAEEGDMPALYSTWGADVFMIEPNPRVWPNIVAIWDANDLRPPVGWFVGLVGDPDMIDTDPTENNVGWQGDPDDGWPICSTGPITMDVEGGEYNVLCGAFDVLMRHRPDVFVSIHPDFMFDMYGHTPGDVINMMRVIGYTDHHLVDDHESHWWFIPDERASS